MASVSEGDFSKKPFPSVDIVNLDMSVPGFGTKAPNAAGAPIKKNWS